jgi:hypothetical protein
VLVTDTRPFIITMSGACAVAYIAPRQPEGAGLTVCSRRAIRNP